MRASTSDVAQRARSTAGVGGRPLLVTILSSILVLSISASVQGERARDQDTADVYYVTRMSDRFLGFMAKHQGAVNNFGDAEQNRIATAIASAVDPNDKMLLENSARVNEENRLEAQNAFGEMRNFVTTLKQAMGGLGSAARCQDLTCGTHAYCLLDQSLGAQCLCKDGYQGNGFICKPTARFVVHSFMQFKPGELRPQVADIHVSTLQGDTIVAVYRDASKSHKGYALLGHAASDTLRWHSPVLFSDQSKAFSPVVTNLLQANGEKGGLAIAYRDADRGGDGILVGGRVDPLTGEIMLGTPKAFARNQAQAMALLPLPESRVVVVFAEHLGNQTVGDASGNAMYGASVLAQVQADGSAPQIMNKARFASGPVARISATALSPTLFAIAYRQGTTGKEQAEASCIVGQSYRNHVSYSSPAILEPEQTNIWSRSLSRIGENLLAYTYHSGTEKVTKQAVLRVDPKTRHLDIVHGPEVIARGFAPVVGSVALVPTAKSEQTKERKTGSSSLSLAEQHQQRRARLLTYVGQDGPKPARAQLCGISDGGVPSGCTEISWAGRDIASISGTQVSDGRFVIAFTDARGNPYYQFIGMNDPSV